MGAVLSSGLLSLRPRQLMRELGSGGRWLRALGAVALSHVLCCPFKQTCPWRMPPGAAPSRAEPSLWAKAGAAVSLSLSQADWLCQGTWEWRGGTCDGLLKCWGAGAGGVAHGFIMVHVLANYVRICQCKA